MPVGELPRLTRSCVPAARLATGLSRVTIVDYRYAEGHLERLHELAADLGHLKVDVLVTASPAAKRPAKEAMSTVSMC